MSDFVRPPRPVGAGFAAGGPRLDLEVEVAELREKVSNLEAALINARSIGAAIGILMCRHNATEDAAFGLLVRASQIRHVKVNVIVADVLLTGELPSG